MAHGAPRGSGAGPLTLREGGAEAPGLHLPAHAQSSAQSPRFLPSPPTQHPPSPRPASPAQGTRFQLLRHSLRRETPQWNEGEREYPSWQRSRHLIYTIALLSSGRAPCAPLNPTHNPPGPSRCNPAAASRRGPTLRHVGAHLISQLRPTGHVQYVVIRPASHLENSSPGSPHATFRQIRLLREWYTSPRDEGGTPTPEGRGPGKRSELRGGRGGGRR